jgi:hypothetical protein
LEDTHGDKMLYPLPPSVLRLSSTLVVARIGFYGFPKEITPSLSLAQVVFPSLRMSSVGSSPVAMSWSH